MKTANLGSVSTGTLRTEDLLSSFISTLEGLLLVNGDHYSRPENFGERDRLNNLVGEAQDCFASDGEGIDPKKQDTADELVNESFPDALQGFAPSYCYFGAHPGDGADFGFWVGEIEEIKEQVGFVSREEIDETTDPDDSSYPAPDYRGEWLHVSDHGNATLYVREDSKTDPAGYADRELWGVV